MVRNAVSYFSLEVRRRVVSLHRPVQLLSCAATVLSCLLLSGCTSAPLLANIYVVSFASTGPPTATASWTTSEPSTTEFSPVEVRVGYFSLCTRAENQVHWICGDQLGNPFRGTPDPWDLYKKAENYRTQVISPIFPIISLALNLASITIVSSFPITRTNEPLSVRERKTRAIVIALPITAIVTVIVTFVAALWQHTTAATASPLVRYLSSSALTCVVGPAGTTFVWLIFGTSLVTGSMLCRASLTISLDNVEDDSTLTTQSRINSWLSERERVSSS
ncbi:Ca2+ regulator and membrane fusion protein Fig1-domain-containing protein [Chaetomium fimeti]|uniref:Ca2+ regulator and membrane fusion protein Fig1-domain-containing protein n=1 Tax=Chaetomium fimeti TaxID=1854472 RepID=A0AAE0H6W6_9PEZI|nr:Ca2+ regulator and membrane fusion protein Fig1-domain-containing protein [Chaetomium fimeti]